MDRQTGTILIVDDDSRLRRILRANVEIVGYDVVEAAGGDEAIAAIDQARPDAIVVDVLPSSNDRPAFVRRVRTHPQGAQIPLIVLTANVHSDDAVRSLEAGADDVVVKPFAPEEMLARVRAKIKRATEDSALQPLTKLPANGPIEAEIRALQRDTRVPYCSVSIAVVSGSVGPTTYERVGERAARVKKEAKRRRGSVVVTEKSL